MMMIIMMKKMNDRWMDWINTYILMVPLGPRLVLRTSCKPLAALMFMWRAADLFRTSAFGFSTRNDIFAVFSSSSQVDGEMYTES